MKTPKVTVVMPVYNVEDYVGDAISSVLSQSFGDFELVIVNDGSEDGSRNVCELFDDARIRIIDQENLGLAGARNTGIRHARGEYIAFLDSDDRWKKEKLALHVIHLDNNLNVDVSYAGSRFIDALGKELKQTQRPRLENVQPEHIFLRNPVGNGSAPVVRRSLLEAAAFPHRRKPGRMCYFDETFRQSEDIELWMRLALKHKATFEGIDGLLTDYRVLPGALSANLLAQYDSWCRVAHNVREMDPAFADEWEARAKAYQLRYLSRRAIQLGDSSMALLLLRDAARESAVAMLKEPRKSVVTLAAATVMHVAPPRVTRTLVKGWTGSEVVA